MYLQEILEVAIGLVFMWLVLSISAMQIQEWIASLFKWRAKGMEATIRSMLGGLDEVQGKKLTEMLYKHPLITGLSSSTRFIHKNPSYIPAGKFAVVLFDIVMSAGTEAWPVKKALAEVEAQVASISNPDERKLAAEDFEALLATAKQIAGTQLGDAAVDSLKLQMQIYGDKYPEFKPAIDLALPQIDIYYRKVIEEQQKVSADKQDRDLTLRQLRLGLLAMETIYPNTKKALGALLAGAEEYAKKGEQGLVTARNNVESWFNDSMDRLIGLYKRKAQKIAFAIGLVLALLLNVDSINIATSLWREPTLRQAIVANATAYAQQTQTPLPGTESGQAGTSPVASVKKLQEELTALNLPIGWTLTPFDTGGKQCALIPINADQIFGFSGKDEKGQSVCKYVSNFPIDWSSGLAKFAGLMMTGAAAAQGAPFWFDILKKLINVRSAGPNPAEKEKAAG